MVTHDQTKAVCRYTRSSINAEQSGKRLINEFPGQCQFAIAGSLTCMCACKRVVVVSLFTVEVIFLLTCFVFYTNW